MVKLLEESTNKKWKVVDIKGKNYIGENVRGFALSVAFATQGMARWLTFNFL